MLWLLIGYMFLFIHRPFEVWPILGTVRLELLYMLMTGAVWLAYPKKRFTLDGLTLAVIGLAAAVVFCTLASAWTDRCLDAIDAWMKFLVFFLLLVTVVQSEEDLRKIIVAFLVVMAGFMLHSLLEYMNGRQVFRMGIRRMIGVDSSGDPNAFAMSVVLSLVFIPVIWRTAVGKWTRLALTAYLGLSSLCVLLTGSRGAFITLLVWTAVVVWNSPWRGRLAALLVPAAPLLFLLLPPSLQNRFETIINPDAGPRNAQVSSEGRIDGFWVGMQLWQANPVAGVGPGAWQVASGRKLKAHNLYGQVAGELGTLGVIAMLALVIGYVRNITAVRRASAVPPGAPPAFLHLVAGAIGTGLFLLLLGGLIGHNLFRTHWIMYAAFLIIARRCVADREAALAYATWDDPGLDADESAPPAWGQLPAYP